MKHDCLRATKICLWYRDDTDGYTDKKKRWSLCSLEPSWYIVCGRPWYELKTGDEIDINISCKIDVHKRVIIDGDRFILINYNGREEDVIVKINKINVIETLDGNYEMVYHSGPLSCSVSDGMTILLNTKSGEQMMYLPSGWTLQALDGQLKKYESICKNK